MSDYFGALLNLSGRVDLRLPAASEHDAPQNETESVEVGSARGVAAASGPPQRGPQTTEMTQTPLDSALEVASPMLPNSDETDVAAAMPNRRVLPRPASSIPSARAEPAAISHTASVNAPAAAIVTTSGAVAPGVDVVRAALAWVSTAEPEAAESRLNAVAPSRQLAADPPGARQEAASRDVDRRHELPQLVTDGASLAIVDSPLRGHPDVSAGPAIERLGVAASRMSRPNDARAGDVNRREPVESAVSPARPPLSEEIVEISIGAIHLRVDAPAVEMPPVYSQAPPAPLPARASAASSALSRRALRSI